MADTPEGYKGPAPPTNPQIDGRAAVADMATQALRRVHVSAKVQDPTPPNRKVKLKVQYSANNFKTAPKVVESDYGPNGERAGVTLSDLKPHTLYRCKLWTVGFKNDVSKNHTTISFWTNRDPSVTLVTPSENAEYNEDQVILFDWQFADPDTPSSQDQRAYSLRYRTSTLGPNGTPVSGAWAYLPPKRPYIQGGAPGKNTFRTLLASTLIANTTYEWTVKVRDKGGVWSDWPLVRSFYVRGLASPPHQLSPSGGIGTAVVVSETVRFSWKFRDPDPANKQTQADIRWRVQGSEDEGAPTDEGWFTTFGEGITPGVTMQWDIAAGHFTPGELYEWQVRTYDDKGSGIPSGWSASALFVAAVAPGSAITTPPLDENLEPVGSLGCGHHRVFVYDRGGRVLRGEIKPLARVQWGRKRDDIGNCLITTNGFDQDCCELLGDLQSWAHELVIFRDQERVFEGPITRITYTSTDVEVEAKDVMAYLYRRVMRQGYNDAFRRIDRTPKTPPQPIGKPGGGPYDIIGVNTVVERALQITLNALAYKDPNVLPYVTAIQYPKDALENRVVADYSRTAWEEIDDLAATAGLDYTTVGRRIVYWDTHRVIGRLPEMRDGDFSDPVIVTEYGMQTSNWFAVTNNNGVAGIAYPLGKDGSNWHERYGPVEMVASAYGEQSGAALATDAMTAAQRDALVKKLQGQATKGIANRWPNPVVVRVPDNSTLSPEVNLGINQLIPGVWIPLRATLTCRKLAQWQKLDSLDVEEIAGQEFVRVTMSPAPHGGDDDPDLGSQEEGS
jgi:hypothetical protein